MILESTKLSCLKLFFFLALTRYFMLIMVVVMIAVSKVCVKLNMQTNKLLHRATRRVILSWSGTMMPCHSQDHGFKITEMVMSMCFIVHSLRKRTSTRSDQFRFASSRKLVLACVSFRDIDLRAPALTLISCGLSLRNLADTFVD